MEPGCDYFSEAAVFFNVRSARRDMVVLVQHGLQCIRRRFQQLTEQFVLGGKVVLQVAQVDSRLTGYVTRGRLSETLLQEEPLRRHRESVCACLS